MHWARWKHNGDPLATKTAPDGAKAAFLLAHYADPADGPCVLWPFPLRKTDGYGTLRFRGRERYSHEAALELRVGPRPPGMIATHGACHQPACIIHVTWGTYSTNMLDKVRDGTHDRGERHAQHKLTESQVHEIRRLGAAGVPHRLIGPQFGVSPTLSSLICRRKRWAWLKEDHSCTL